MTEDKKQISMPELKQRLAKHVQDLINRHADSIQDLRKRELFKTNVMEAAHMEPGQHEPGQVGVPDHMEPGQHEQFTVNPAEGPEAAVAQPVTSGIGVPQAQLDNQTPNGSLSCPMCGQPEQAGLPNSCHCLDAMAMGKTSLPMNQGPAGPTAPPGPTMPMAMSEKDMCKNCGKSHDMDKNAMCKSAKLPDGSGFMTGTVGKKEPSQSGPGRNGDPTKQQPSPPAPGAILPPEKGGKKVANKADDNKPKPNPLGKEETPASRIKGKIKTLVQKMTVPEAKPPSGKVPGQTQPPMASNTSKPALGKAVLPMAAAKQMQAHAAQDSFRAAVGAGPKLGGAAAMAPGHAGAPTLTSPHDPSRANMHQAALGGAFQPKPGAKISSGLELARPPAPMRPGAPPTPAPKPSPFGKSETCVFCHGPEHVGACSKK